VDDEVLSLLDKGHTRANFVQASERLREMDLVLNPTFVSFTPWTTPVGFLEMLSVIHDLDLVTNVNPIQYAIRLLIPAGSRLLELSEIREMVSPFDHSALSYPWAHPDPDVDRLYERVMRLVRDNLVKNESRTSLFEQLWQTIAELIPESRPAFPGENGWDLAAKPVPRLSESWY
jgi:hypothetical protein